MTRVTYSDLGFKEFLHTMSCVLTSPPSSIPSSPRDEHYGFTTRYRDAFRKAVDTQSPSRDACTHFPLMRLPSDILWMVISYCGPYCSPFNCCKGQDAKRYKRYYFRRYRDDEEEPWDWADERPEDKSVIKNLRLTCRTLCRMSSQHLIHQITVDMTTESLIRLRQISEHPQIRMGVFSVRLILSHWAGQLAMIPTFYIRQLTGRMNDECVFQERDEGGYFGHDGYEHICERLRAAAGAVEEELSQQGNLWDHSPGIFWSRLRSRLPKSFFWCLFNAYFAYRRLYTDYEAARTGFCAKISEAMAQLPCATQLTITDKPRYSQILRAQKLHHSIDENSPWDSEASKRILVEMNAELLNLPIAWMDQGILNDKYGLREKTAHLQSCPVEVLFHLAPLLAARGICLTRMEIRITAPPALPEAFPDVGNKLVRESTNRLSSNLRHFTFTIQHGDWYRAPVWKQSYSESIKTLAKHFIVSSPELEHIHLDLCCLRGRYAFSPDLWIGEPLDYDLFREEGNPELRWQNLKHLDLSGVDTNAADLLRLIRNTDCVRLNDVYLHDGNWEEVLDMLVRVYCLRSEADESFRLFIENPSQRKEGEEKWVECEDVTVDLRGG